MDDVDPLDAFMATINQEVAAQTRKHATMVAGHKRKHTAMATQLEEGLNQAISSGRIFRPLSNVVVWLSRGISAVLWPSFGPSVPCAVGASGYKHAMVCNSIYMLVAS